MPKMLNLASFWKHGACGQIVLPDRLVLIGQKLVENAKIQKFKCNILRYFQTMPSNVWWYFVSKVRHGVQKSPVWYCIKRHLTSFNRDSFSVRFFMPKCIISRVFIAKSRDWRRRRVSWLLQQQHREQQQRGAQKIVWSMTSKNHSTN